MQRRMGGLGLRQAYTTLHHPTLPYLLPEMPLQMAMCRGAGHHVGCFPSEREQLISAAAGGGSVLVLTRKKGCAASAPSQGGGR